MSVYQVSCFLSHSVVLCLFWLVRVHLLLSCCPIEHEQETLLMQKNRATRCRNLKSARTKMYEKIFLSEKRVESIIERFQTTEVTFCHGYDFFKNNYPVHTSRLLRDATRPLSVGRCKLANGTPVERPVSCRCITNFLKINQHIRNDRRDKLAHIRTCLS